MEPKLTGTHRRTYETIFRHPAAHNLEWRDVRSLLNKLAEIEEEHNGNLKVTRNGQTIVLTPPLHKDIADVDELMKIRHFLESSGEVAPTIEAPGSHLLVVIDHREARIYRAEQKGALPERITPYDPHGYGRHLHYVQNDSNGQRKPELKSFYNLVAQTLHGAGQILIFGTGTGGSSAMDHLLAELKFYHPDVAGHIVGSVAVDEQHLTENQLLARAREFYNSANSVSVK
jgi:hypothetical protein